MCRNPCKECPFVVKSQHNEKWKKYSDRMKSNGYSDQGCHMITKDVWGLKEEINNSNRCVGAVKKIK